MKNTRFLLPCTQNIDLDAVAYTMQFARSRQAIVVPLMLNHGEEAHAISTDEMITLLQADIPIRVGREGKGGMRHAGSAHPAR